MFPEGASIVLGRSDSFRIRACSEAILQGMPQESVMALGRWSSRAAFKRYIRIL